MSEITIALVGNPNVGKSTVFNALTGANQQVGNWPGKTVERRSGTFLGAPDGITGRTPPHRPRATIVDLPGTYSLSAYSPEEEIARDFIIEERPQLVINVLDASNIERNLYLTAQLLETGVPLLIVLNMQDQADARGVQIDPHRLSALLGQTPVVPLVARRGQGMNALRELITTYLAKHAQDGGA